ncbi:hypothetical protein J5N97_001600, partial [Dioscorea zingiberensis]
VMAEEGRLKLINGFRGDIFHVNTRGNSAERRRSQAPNMAADHRYGLLNHQLHHSRLSVYQRSMDGDVHRHSLR